MRAVAAFLKGRSTLKMDVSVAEFAWHLNSWNGSISSIWRRNLTCDAMTEAPNAHSAHCSTEVLPGCERVFIYPIRTKFV
jgi:hypothetical protein